MGPSPFSTERLQGVLMNDLPNVFVQAAAGRTEEKLNRVYAFKH